MSLTSKAQAYDVLVKQLLEMLNKGNIEINCDDPSDLITLNNILNELENVLEDWG